MEMAESRHRVDSPFLPIYLSLCCNLHSTTLKCQHKHGVVTIDGHKINVIDTPGLFDLFVSAEYISREIVRCLTLAEGWIHAVLLVLSARNRIIQEEENKLSTLQALFGSQILDYVIVVFTGGDVLEECNETLEDYFGRDCPAFIKEAMRLSGNRKVVIDNKSHDESKKAEQVHTPLSLIDEIRRNNSEEAYTNDMYHEIKVETDRLRKQHKELELKNHSKELMLLMKDQLHELYQENVNRVSNIRSVGITELESRSLISNKVEKKLKDALEAQEKALSKFGNNYVHLGTNDQQSLQPTITILLPPIPGISCNIL